MAREGYSYLRMLQALNLVVFSVTIAAQLLSFGESLFVLSCSANSVSSSSHRQERPSYA